MTASLFTITPTPPTTITLAPGGEGKFSFTITSLAAPDRSFELILQALLVGADGKTSEAEWLGVGPAPTLSLTGGETQTVFIVARPTTKTPPGKTTVKLALGDKTRPNDEFTYSAPVVCQIDALVVEPPKPKKFPWWIAAVAGGVVVLAGAGILIWKLTSRGGGPPPVGDAGAPAADAAPVPVPDAALPAFAPLHVQSVLPGAPDLALSGISATIDTTAHKINGAENPFFVQQGDNAVLFAGAFTLQSPLAVTGSFPLIIVATGPVTIGANIDVTGHGAVGGPGAMGVGHPGAGGVGVRVVVQTPEGGRPVFSGGGGASHGTLGGSGGSSNPSKVPAGASGVRYGLQIGDPLLGGAPGGGGTATLTNGGGGGGALQISSAVSITVNAGAAINAGGGGGGAGGGGGGAGGELLLEAPGIAVAGVLAANGGGGGGGNADGGRTPPRAGDPGLPGPGPAQGGAGGVPSGSRGGNGAATIDGTVIDATPGDHDNSNGGGGGGGAGRIWLRYRGASPPRGNGIITPPPGKDPSLP